MEYVRGQTGDYIIIIIIIIIQHLYSALKSCKGYGGADWLRISWSSLFIWQQASAPVLHAFLPCGYFFPPFFPRLISAVAGWMSAILPHMVWPSANFRRRSETCCTRRAENTGRKKVAKNRHLGTIAHLTALTDWAPFYLLFLSNEGNVLKVKLLLRGTNKSTSMVVDSVAYSPLVNWKNRRNTVIFDEIFNFEGHVPTSLYRSEPM